MQTRPPEWQDWADAIVKIEYAQAYLREDAVHYGCPMDDPCRYGEMARGLAPSSPSELPISASDTRSAATSRETWCGRTWEQHAGGLDIPILQTLFADATSGLLFAVTPAGFYLSRDRAETWEDANLKLIFDANTKREVGGAAYLDAYWRGRYYGFITGEQDIAHPDTWEGHPPQE